MPMMTTVRPKEHAYIKSYIRRSGLERFAPNMRFAICDLRFAPNADIVSRTGSLEQG